MKLLTAIASTAFGICAFISPIHAAPTNCWLGDPRVDDRLHKDSCDISIRTNANGHQVIDIQTRALDTKMSLVVWYEREADQHGDVEVFYKGKRADGYWLIDKDGDYQIGFGDLGPFLAFDLTPNQHEVQSVDTRGTLSDTPFRF